MQNVNTAVYHLDVTKVLATYDVFIAFLIVFVPFA